MWVQGLKIVYHLTTNTGCNCPDRIVQMKTVLWIVPISKLNSNFTDDVVLVKSQVTLGFQLYLIVQTLDHTTMIDLEFVLMIEKVLVVCTDPGLEDERLELLDLLIQVCKLLLQFVSCWFWNTAVRIIDNLRFKVSSY